MLICSLDCCRACCLFCHNKLNILKCRQVWGLAAWYPSTSPPIPISKHFIVPLRFNLRLVPPVAAQCVRSWFCHFDGHFVHSTNIVYVFSVLRRTGSFRVAWRQRETRFPGTTWTWGPSGTPGSSGIPWIIWSAWKTRRYWRARSCWHVWNIRWTRWLLLHQVTYLRIYLFIYLLYAHIFCYWYVYLSYC